MVYPFLLKLEPLFENTYLYNMGLSLILQLLKIVYLLPVFRRGTSTSMVYFPFADVQHLPEAGSGDFWCDLHQTDLSESH